MLIVITCIAALAAAQGAWHLHRLWRAVPQRNSDFGPL